MELTKPGLYEALEKLQKAQSVCRVQQELLSHTDAIAGAEYVIASINAKMEELQNRLELMQSEIKERTVAAKECKEEIDNLMSALEGASYEEISNNAKIAYPGITISIEQPKCHIYSVKHSDVIVQQRETLDGYILTLWSKTDKISISCECSPYSCGSDCKECCFQKYRNIRALTSDHVILEISASIRVANFLAVVDMSIYFNRVCENAPKDYKCIGEINVTFRRRSMKLLINIKESAVYREINLGESEIAKTAEIIRKKHFERIRIIHKSD